MTFNVSHKITDSVIKFYVNDVLYVSIKRWELIGFQSWVEGEDTKKYVIEFYLKTNDFALEFDEKIKWIKFLKKLDTIDFYSKL